jgi:hypothetical protein
MFSYVTMLSECVIHSIQVLYIFVVNDIILLLMFVAFFFMASINDFKEAKYMFAAHLIFVIVIRFTIVDADTT